VTNSITLEKLDIKPAEWQEISHILKTYAPQHEVWAFGSRVNNTARQFSDLDLAIMTKHPLPLSEFAILKEAFEQSGLPYKVDIVDWAATSMTFQGIIKTNKIMIQPPYEPLI